MKRLHDLHDVDNDIEHLWPEPAAGRTEHAPSDLTPAGAEQEIAQLKMSLDEQDDALRKANRRVDRLIGEKTQLKAMLEKRDCEIQHLNRELGGHASGRRFALASDDAAALKRLSPTTLLVSIGERLRALFLREPAVAENSNAALETTLSDKIAHQPLVATQHGRSTQGIVAVVMLGLGRDEIERLLPIVEQDCASRSMAPLCLVDIDAFEMLRGRDLVFEYLPPQDDRDRFDASLHWDLYIQRRLALIRRKWNPVRVVAFGTSAMRTLTLWSSSPFEDVPLPATSGETLVP